MNRETIAFIAASAGLAAAARRSLAILQGSSNGKTLLDVVATYGKDLQLFEDGLNKIIERQDDLYAHLASSVRNIAVVRYDAFEDMGGRLSFSAALMDEHGSGLVLSAISGRLEARAYAKIIEEGESEMGLSPEERKAIDEAMSGKKQTRTKVKARR